MAHTACGDAKWNKAGARARQVVCRAWAGVMGDGMRVRVMCLGRNDG